MTGPAPWDGVGLPASARARLDRSTRSGLRTSLLSVSGTASLAAAGFEPVGEVMGSAVMHLGFRGFANCGYSGYPMTGGQYGSYGAGVPATVTSGSGQRYAGYGPYAKAVYTGYDTALGRMADEAAALGGDGVVGVRLTAEFLEGGNREFVALGTAVRARNRTGVRAPARPFTTELAGTDVAKLLAVGWVPVAICVGVSVGIRHDDWQTQSQANSWQNVEVFGYTDLVSTVRAEARHEFDRRARAVGADSAVVSRMGLSIWETEAGGHRDHVAQATVLGGTVARFARRPAGPPPLSILPLTERSRRR